MLTIMLALLRGPGPVEWSEEVPKPDDSGMIFIRVVHGGTFIPYRTAGEFTEDDLPIFGYTI